MKLTRLIVVTACFAVMAVTAHAQQAVTDGGLYSILSAQQQQILQQWTTSIGKLQSQLTTEESQLTTAEQQLTTLTNVQTYIGNPAAIAGNINIGQLTSQLTNNPLTKDLQALTSDVNQVSGVISNPLSLFPTIPTTTASGMSITRDTAQYKPFAAFDQVYQAGVTATQSLQTQMQAVQSDIATTESQMQTASDQATVQKLQAKLQGDQAQLSNLQSQVSQANQQVLTQKAENDAHTQETADADNEALGEELNSMISSLKQIKADEHDSSFLTQ